MGLFNKKKEEKILPLPEFPKLPSETNFPFYDEQINTKKEMPMPTSKTEEFRLPEFKTSDFKLPELKQTIEQDDFSFETQKPKFEKFDKQELSFEEIAPRRSPLVLERQDNKPLFVKVDKYRESVKTISSVKIKLEEADSILKNLSKLREDEEKELQEWQTSLDEIRQKLLKVDKDLFEV